MIQILHAQTKTLTYPHGENKKVQFGGDIVMARSLLHS